MNANALLLLTVALGVAGVTSAQNEVSSCDRTTPNAQTPWNTDPNYWQRVLREAKESPVVKLGKSDYVISGPLVNGWGRRSPPGLSLSKRMVRLPIVRLFVPDPMPTPPGGGRYFLWSASSRPWPAIAESAAAGDLSNPIRHEARTSLIAISR